MENFNKNWLAILLIAVVFGTLGFLVGRTTGHHRHHRHHPAESKHLSRHLPADSVEIEVHVDAQGVKTATRTDTVIRDGKTIIIQEVRKIKP